MLRSLAVLAITAALGGCAFSEDTPDIKYLPTQAGLVPDAKPVGLTVVDARTADRNRISAKVNGFGMEMAAIRSKADVSDVVKSALETEFDERGFHVTKNGVAVTVSIDRFYNQFGVGAFNGTATGDVELAVAVATPSGQSLYSGTFTGASKTSVLMASGSNAAESVAAALKDAVGKMFSDPAFLSALTRAPPESRPVG